MSVTVKARQRSIIGVALLGVGLLAIIVAAFVPGISAMLLAIVVGVLLKNINVVPSAATPAISWASKKFLRLGIVFLGFKLSLMSLVDIGLHGVLTLTITVLVTFVGTLFVGKALRISRGMRLLVATGFSICGASAVAAMSSVTDPDSEREEDTAQAVALVTIYGTVAMFILPALVPALGLSDLEAGIWIGASVHEVAQVVAAGAIVSSVALAVATVAKLGRVVLLAPLIAIVSGLEHRRTAGKNSERPPLLPLFIIGFLAAVLMRTVVPIPEIVLDGFSWVTNLLLAAAMLGLGFGVDLRKLIATGARPLVLGAASTVIAAGTALIMILVVK